MEASGSDCLAGSAGFHGSVGSSIAGGELPWNGLGALTPSECKVDVSHDLNAGSDHLRPCETFLSSREESLSG